MQTTPRGSVRGPRTTLSPARRSGLGAFGFVRLLVLALVASAAACGGNDEEVGGNPSRGPLGEGQGGTFGSLPGAAGRGGGGAGGSLTTGAGGSATTGGGGTATTGAGGGLQGFALRVGALGRDQAAPPQGLKVRFGGISPSGRVCNADFCVTGDIR